MKEMGITEVKSKLLQVFADCQAEDILVTRRGKPFVVLSGHERLKREEANVVEEIYPGVKRLVVTLLAEM